MKVIALTGGIGAGKSTVAQFFSELGANVVDADHLARIAIERGSEGFDEVVARFGETILANGDINRKALAEIVFSDPSAKSDLEGIIHPRVQKLFAQALIDNDPATNLIYEIPLLVETDAASKFDFIVTVEADEELRSERLLARGMFISDIKARLANQAPSEARRAIADAVIVNDGDEDHLLRQVENLWEGPIADLSSERTR
ncbi:MAG: dephospho-CoA kinase [Candidatus Planktophila sp.]|nr:dephospho-CoA kinase [Candidatus Planktophila sp.]